MRTMVLVGAAAALLSACSSSAQAEAGPSPRLGAGPGAPAWEGAPARRVGSRGLGLRALEAADANGDRSVTRAELDALAAEVFTYRDRNADGVLDLADQSPVVQRLAARRAAAPDDDRPPPRRARAGRVDADRDGAVSRAEYLDVEARMFARLDADADGVITPDELDAHADARRDRDRWWRAP